MASSPAHSHLSHLTENSSNSDATHVHSPHSPSMSGMLLPPLPPLPHLRPGSQEEADSINVTPQDATTAAAAKGNIRPLSVTYFPQQRPPSNHSPTSTISATTTVHSDDHHAHNPHVKKGKGDETIKISDDEAYPSVPTRSYAVGDDVIDDGVRTNNGNTKVVMAILSEMWLFNLAFILGGTYLMTFVLGRLQEYDDNILWDTACYWRLGWLLPLPYTVVCFVGLILPFRTNKFIDNSETPKRRLDNLYILTVTKGSNNSAVLRAWEAHRHLERLHPAIKVHILTDAPYHIPNINCHTCPLTFITKQSKYKARALEWYRQTMKYTEHDWILHLDEESVIDDESVTQCLEFIWYAKEFHYGQGVILYNQYKYWANWFFTVADAIRVGDDLSRFHLQYTYLHRPVFGAHGSFLLTNGLVENAVTWDLGSLTEDYQFAMSAWTHGFKCGKIAGLVREQSPLDVIGFLKQRRRWYVGIRRLPHILPKIWAGFWTLGILSLYATIASVVLGFVVPMSTPRWFGLLKDFSFVTFVYLYLVGIFVQEVDRRSNIFLGVIRICATLVVQFAAVAMEGVAVMYGILFPPQDFDVIKK